MGLKELIADLKGERAKGDKADQAVISGLLDDIEPIASRDYATIKRLEAKASGKSTEDVTALENQIVALTNERDDAKNESVKLAKSAKAEESKRMAAEKERDEKVGASEGAISQLLVDGGLASALSGKVRPAHLEAVKGLLSRSVTVESDGKSRSAIAVLKDKDGKERKVAVADFVKEWLGGDIGKEFAIDQGGTGGGAGGSGAPGAGSTGKRARYDVLNAKKPEELSRSDGLELVMLAADPEVTKKQ